MAVQFRIDEMYEEIESKASNNKDKQAYIHPSQYGFSNNQEGTNLCVTYLYKFHKVKTVSIAAKNLLLVTIF